MAATAVGRKRQDRRKVEFQIADIAGEMFDLSKPQFHFFHLLALLRDFLGIGFCIGRAFGHFTAL